LDGLLKDRERVIIFKSLRPVKTIGIYLLLNTFICIIGNDQQGLRSKFFQGKIDLPDGNGEIRFVFEGKSKS
jgi:hypothetical protein